MGEVEEPADSGVCELLLEDTDSAGDSARSNASLFLFLCLALQSLAVVERASSTRGLKALMMLEGHGEDGRSADGEHAEDKSCSQPVATHSFDFSLECCRSQSTLLIFGKAAMQARLWCSRSSPRRRSSWRFANRPPS